MTTNRIRGGEKTDLRRTTLKEQETKMSNLIYREPVRLDQPSKVFPTANVPTPIQQQPKNQQVNVVQSRAVRNVWAFEHPWSESFFSCCSNSKQCIFAFCCLCCFDYQLFKSAGENPCTCICPAARFALRSKIRTAFRIEGDLLNDCCATTCCPCCASLQLTRELQHQGF